jgi:hypothetical protein
VEVELHALLAGKILRYSLDRRLNGFQSRSGRGGEKKIPTIAFAEN